jgi:hypothetical protein
MGHPRHGMGSTHSTPDHQSHKSAWQVESKNSYKQTNKNHSSQTTLQKTRNQTKHSHTHKKKKKPSPKPIHLKHTVPIQAIAALGSPPRHPAEPEAWQQSTISCSLPCLPPAEFPAIRLADSAVSVALPSEGSEMKWDESKQISGNKIETRKKMHNLFFVGAAPFSYLKVQHEPHWPWFYAISNIQINKQQNKQQYNNSNKKKPIYNN